MQHISPNLFRRGTLFLLLFLTSFTLFAQENTYNQPQFNHLIFRPHPSQPDLMMASDSLNNTWIRGTFKADELNTDLTFQIQNAHIYSYDFYANLAGNYIELIPNIDSKKNQVKSRFAQYNFNTAYPYYYINLKQTNAINLPIVIKEQTQFVAKESFHLLRIGLYYGIAIMSIVFNFVFYFLFQDKRFLTYSLLQISIFTSLFFEDGMFYYMSNGTWEMTHLLTWNVPITSLLACFFTIYFLDIKALFNTYKLIFISLFIATFFLSAIQTLLNLDILKHMINILSFLPPFFSLILAATQFRTNVYARFLICTFGFIVLFGLGYTLYMYVNLSKFAWFDIDTFRLISNIEIISITFAIIYKVRDIQEENNGYKDQINKYLQLINTNMDTHEDTSSRIQHNVLQNILENLKISYNLTVRETEVLKCIWEGMSNQEISDKLFISISTTKYHISNLYTKLEIKNRNQALLFKNKKRT